MTVEQQISPSLEARINRLSEGEKLAVVMSSYAFRFGGNWSFLSKDNPEFAETLETLKEVKANVSLTQLSNGLLLQCREQFLEKIVTQVLGPDVLGAPFANNMAERKAREYDQLDKFSQRLLSGEEKSARYDQGYAAVTIGIYSVNDTNYIRSDGRDTRAYKVTVAEAVTRIEQAVLRKGKSLYIRVVDGTKAMFVDSRSLKNSKGLSAIYKGLQIASSDTGVFLSIRVR